MRFTTLQVSELYPGDIPTTIDILITDSTDDPTIQNINDVMLMEGSQDNILTTVDTITLQSNMKYTIQISYSNLVGEFSITTSVVSELLYYYNIVCTMWIICLYNLQILFNM